MPALKDESRKDRLRLCESSYRALVENMLEGFIHCEMIFDEKGRPEDFIYRMVNPAFERLTGYRNVTGRKVTEVSPGARDSYAGVFEILGRVASTGRSETFETTLFLSGERVLVSAFSVEKGFFFAVFQIAIGQREGEEKFRLIFESSPNALIMSDEQGRIVLVNPQVEKVFGYSSEELIGKTVEDLMPQRFRERHVHDHRGFVSAPGSGRMAAGREVFALRKDGSEFLVEAGITGIRIARRLFVLSTIVDVTEQKRAERRIREYQQNLEALVQKRTEELREAQRFSESVIENIPDMVFVKDARELRFVRLNRAGQDLLGISREEMYGRNDYDFFPRSQADFFRLSDLDVLKKGALLDVPEEPIETRERGQRILHTKKIPIPDTEGNPLYLLGISEDITEKKQLEEARLQLLQERAAHQESSRASRRFEFLAETSRTLAGSLDLQTTVRSLARLAVSFFSDGCVIFGQNLKPLAIDARTPEKAARIADFFERFPLDPEGRRPTALVLQTGKPLLETRTTEQRFRALGMGEEHFQAYREFGLHSFISVPLIVRQRVFAVLDLLSTDPSREFDESDLSLAEEFARLGAMAMDNAFLYGEAQKAIQLREDFMSIASHELKTPLTPLKLQLQLLRSLLQRESAVLGMKAQDLTQMIDRSDRQVSRLAKLVEDLLEISRGGSRLIQLNREHVDLRELVKEIVDRFQWELKAANCVPEILGTGPVVGWWDRIRMEQVIENLLTNAMKYGAGHPIRITVLARETHALLKVQDFGIGVAMEDRERIFGRFERAAPAKQFGGLGLGLYIIRQIVEAQGGSISLESEPKKGSTFVVELPL